MCGKMHFLCGHFKSAIASWRAHVLLLSRANKRNDPRLRRTFFVVTNKLAQPRYVPTTEHKNTSTLAKKPNYLRNNRPLRKKSREGQGRDPAEERVEAFFPITRKRNYEQVMLAPQHSRGVLIIEYILPAGPVPLTSP